MIRDGPLLSSYQAAAKAFAKTFLVPKLWRTLDIQELLCKLCNKSSWFSLEGVISCQPVLIPYALGIFCRLFLRDVVATVSTFFGLLKGISIFVSSATTKLRQFGWLRDGETGYTSRFILQHWRHWCCKIGKAYIFLPTVIQFKNYPP